MKNLEQERIFNYTKEETIQNHPNAKCYAIKFLAIDNSEIYADLFIPKSNCKGIFLEFPDYKTPPKDYLNLSRYSIHNYAVLSLHIRGQVGKSKNNQPWSIYAPFLETNYYNYVYQDALDVLQIVKKEFGELPIYTLCFGQGAGISVVISAITNKITEQFIANIDICDLETIYKENHDSGYYMPIREYARYNLDKEQEMLEVLNKIDVINYAPLIKSKTHYGMSYLNPQTPLASQNKFLSLIKNKEIVHYRKFEKEVLQEHFFDEYVLEKLADK